MSDTLLQPPGYFSDELRDNAEAIQAQDDILSYLRERFGNTDGVVDLGAHRLKTSSSIDEAQGVDIVSATIIDLGAATGNYVVVTGNVNISGITLAQGSRRKVRFSGTPILVHGANLQLIGAANIAVHAGDIAEFVGEAGGVVRMTDYVKVDGHALISPQISPAFKNLLIGGDFTTNPWQRGANFSGITNTSLYTADRWAFACGGSAVWAVSQQFDAPTTAQAGVGATSCIEIKCTSAVTSPAATDYAVLYQAVEGVNSAFLGFGQAGAQSVTIAPWYKTNVSGNFVVQISNSATNRSYVVPVTLVGDGTWRRMPAVTIPGDISGTWLANNGIGLNLRIAVVCGTTYQNTANTWVAANAFGVAGMVNLGSAVNNYLRLCLLQLEPGISYTSFEALPVDVVLARCQRYFEKSYSQGVAPGTVTTAGCFITADVSVPHTNYFGSVKYALDKRASPTVTMYDPTSGGTGAWRNASSTSFSVQNGGGGTSSFFVQNVAGGLISSAYVFGHWTANAEL